MRKDNLMNAAIKKAASGKTMRVAAVFTGASACVAAFTPGAMAATYAAANPLHQGGAVGKIQPDIPATVRKSCNFVGDSTWLHIAFNIGHSTCFGHTGSIYLSRSAITHASGFCGGNNSGRLEYIAPDGGHFRGFFPGTYYAHLPTSHPAVVYVSISNYHDNDMCGRP
jgi:hypothetical protein